MPHCPVCSHENPTTALFCARCTSPVAVLPLHELGEAVHRECLAALFESLAQISRTAGPGEIADRDLWRAYLDAFWLRPETALVLYAEALAIRPFRDAAAGPWLDLGCGDGIHAAIYSGYRFGVEFDAFSALDLGAADIYNHFDPAQFSAPITRAGRGIDYALDIKPTAVARATALGAFKEVVRADATTLPLADRSVGGIFSNMLRDLGEPLPAALAECRRVLKDDGVLLLSAMTPAYAQSLHFAPAARAAQAAGDSERARHLLKLDRGRSVFCQRQLSLDQWRPLLDKAGLALRRAHPLVGDRAIRFWDVGLRPFTHALLHRRQNWVDAGLLGAVKPSLVAMLDYLLDPLVRTVGQGTPCMHLLEIRKVLP
jgi:SAM-dependent methyltransferase